MRKAIITLEKPDRTFIFAVIGLNLPARTFWDKKMKFLKAFFLIVAFLCSPALAESQTVKIAATEYPPFYGKDLKDNGFMTEIIREALKRKELTADVSFLPWKRALASAKSGKHDGLFTIWHRPEREEWFVFSDALPSNELVFFKRKDSDISSSKYDDLKDYKIGIVRGYAPPPGFDDAGLSTSPAKDDEENLRKLHKGRVDIILTDRIVAQHIINTRLSDWVGDFEWIDPPAHVDIQYLVFSKKTPNHQNLMEAFNAGLAEMTMDGTLISIMAKHGF